MSRSEMLTMCGHTIWTSEFDSNFASPAHRRPFIVLLEIGLVVLANYLAFWLRFDGAIPVSQLEFFWQMLPWLVGIRGFNLYPFPAV